MGGHSQSLASRLDTARRRSFVGRVSELELFRAALREQPSPFAVLYLHGPGGVGKTALLHRFAQEARGVGLAPVLLDGRNVDPAPEGVLAALRAALELPGGQHPLATLSGSPRPVLLIDGYEALAPVDGWVRHEVIPRLPVDATVVLAGRNPPAAGWRADPGWQELLRVTALRDLHPDDARELLAVRGVPASRHDEVLRFARGHPLALVLVADVLAQQAGHVPFSAHDAPDVLQLLLDRFVREVPSDAHRQALEACAQAGVATEALLRDTVEGGGARELFDWLARLSFTQQVAGGVAVHDLVREILDADLRRRDPERYATMHRRIARHLQLRVDRTTGNEQRRLMQDLLQLYRFQPLAREFFNWEATQDSWVEPASAADHAAIRAMVADHEGEESAAIADYWLERQPEAFQVFRTAGDDGPTGLMAHLVLGDTPGEETEVDPVAASAWVHARSVVPLRTGEVMRLLRFWIGRDSHQDVATHHLVSSQAALDWLTTPRMAWSFVLLADPTFWEPIFRFIDFERPSGIDVSIGGRDHGLFARDWRSSPPAAWMQLLHERRLSAADTPTQLPRAHRRLLVLSKADFEEAVRHALRSYRRPGGLDDNPLLVSRVVHDRETGRPPADVLKELLEDALAPLADHPRDEKLLRALRATYFSPAPTQEAAAERLDLPFSTYRRHLAAGIEHVTNWLWDRELHGHGDDRDAHLRHSP